MKMKTTLNNNTDTEECSLEGKKSLDKTCQISLFLEL